MKALLDSSVLVSAFVVAESLPGQAVRAGLQGRFRLLLSPAILAETARSLREKPGLRRRYAYTEAELDRHLRDLAVVGEMVTDVPAIPRVCRDPDDDHVLAAALAAGAECIVTGDGDLLDLQVYQGVRILTVRRFLEELS